MIGEAIGAGAKLVGVGLDAWNADRNRKEQDKQWRANLAAQYDFAQNGIKWKVADAQASGIHPLYALGANTQSFSPISIGGNQTSSFASDLGSMGQDIGRAVQATRSGDERQKAFETSMAEAQLEGAKLDNDIKRASLASSVARLRAQANPPMPGLVPEADKFEDRPKLMSSHVHVNTDPGSANAEDFEKRYGDIAQEIAGVHNMYRDYMATTGGMTPRQIFFRGGRHPLNKFLYGDQPWVVPGGVVDRVVRSVREGYRRGRAYYSRGGR